MTATERVRRIAALQDEVDRVIALVRRETDQLIESCEDGECCPCPTCETLEDVQRMLIVAQGHANWAADPVAEVVAEVA